jgi:hypothetical protein
MPRAEGREDTEGRGERTEALTSYNRSKECGTTRVPMSTVLVGRGFAHRKWFANLLLASRLMWRGQPYSKSSAVTLRSCAWQI